MRRMTETIKTIKIGENLSKEVRYIDLRKKFGFPAGETNDVGVTVGLRKKQKDPTRKLKQRLHHFIGGVDV